MSTSFAQRIESEFLRPKPSPAQESSQALTEGLAAPEATGHLEASASLQRELL